MKDMKDVRSKRQKDKETLASVLKEMGQPRFAESTRKEEEDANHDGPERANSEHLEPRVKYHEALSSRRWFNRGGQHSTANC
jgi:hypothetical protein